MSDVREGFKNCMSPNRPINSDGSPNRASVINTVNDSAVLIEANTLTSKYDLRQDSKSLRRPNTETSLGSSESEGVTSCDSDYRPPSRCNSDEDPDNSENIVCVQKDLPANTNPIPNACTTQVSGNLRLEQETDIEITRVVATITLPGPTISSASNIPALSSVPNDNQQPLNSMLSLHQIRNKESFTVSGLSNSSPPFGTSRLSSVLTSRPPTDSSIRPSLEVSSADHLNALRLYQPSSSRASTQKHTSIATVELASSDNDSTEMDDSLIPGTRRRKRPTPGIEIGSASESGDSDEVDPDYVPPPRERLPLKTPDSVLKAIPSYQPKERNNLVNKDSNDGSSRPENECNVCLRDFDDQELLTQHQDKSFSDLKCCKCVFRAAGEKYLIKHFRKHTNKAKPYKCEDCGQYFTVRTKFVRHFLMHRDDYYYKCNQCGQGFFSYTPYKAHVNKHLNVTPYKCRKCDEAFISKACLTDHKKRRHKRKAYAKCNICGKIIVKFWLAKHMRRHEDTKKYLCEHCGKEFKLKQTLSIHIRQKHTEERPHMCTDCGATFKQAEVLRQHMRKHTGERPYMCDVCSKTFAYRTPYNYHKRTHTGERPYKCEFCDMTFAQPSPYAVHKRLHTGERPYSCEICAEAFSSHAALRNHMQTHGNVPKKKDKKRTTTSEGKRLNSKRQRKRRSYSEFESCSSTGCSSDSGSEEMEVDSPKPRRKSGRQTKCNQSLEEENSNSDSE